jgi:hypothetical protein
MAGQFLVVRSWLQINRKIDQSCAEGSRPILLTSSRRAIQAADLFALGFQSRSRRVFRRWRDLETQAARARSDGHRPSAPADLAYTEERSN